MEQTKRLQDLEVNKKYKVLKRKVINAPYGKTYILKVVDEMDIEFELFATKTLTTYIDKECPTAPFEFKVLINNNVKYPAIDNYTQDSDGFVPF